MKLPWKTTKSVLVKKRGKKQQSNLDEFGIQTQYRKTS